jgi:hypothetical protein
VTPAPRGLADSALALALAGLFAMLAACGHSEVSREQHPDWVIHTRLVFLSEDLQSTLEPLPLDRFRLVFSYISGDLYGSSTTGDFVHPVIDRNYGLEIDLNRTHPDLMRSLEPTEFSFGYLRIDPADTRIARLAPLAVLPDGIEQVGALDWVDPRVKQRLMLVYFDRPSRITGGLTRDGRTVRYNVRVSAPGYVWIADHAVSDTERMYSEVEKPAEIVLALTPTPAPAPARAPTPAQMPAPAKTSTPLRP